MGRQTRFGHHRRVVVDDVLLDRDEEDFHLALFVGQRSENLEIEVHLFDLEGDVLLGLPLDLLLEFRLGHEGQLDLLHDQGVAGDRRRDVPVLQLEVRDEVADRLDDNGRVHDDAIDDGFGGELRDSEVL